MKKKKLGIIPKIGIGLLFIISFLYVYMHYLEPTWITYREYAFYEDDLPSSMNGLKIVHFGDIHFGRTINESEMEQLITNINKAKPDIILFTGDLFDSYINLSQQNIDFLIHCFQKLDPPLGKYTVFGDSDYIDETAYRNIMNESHFILLENETKTIYYKGNQPIYITGIPSISKNPLKENSIQKEDGLHLTIIHEPIIFDSIHEYTDYAFAGHSLGGLIRIPFYGGIIKKDHMGNYDFGLYENNDSTLVVTNGIGTESYSLRFLNQPSFYLYRFYSVKKES